MPIPIHEIITCPDGYSWGFYHYQWQIFHCNWHKHAEYELTLTLNACGNRVIGSVHETFDHHDLALIGPNIPHLWECALLDKQKPVDIYVLWFRPDWIDALTDTLFDLSDIKLLFDQAHYGMIFSQQCLQKITPLVQQLAGAAPRHRFMLLLDIFNHLIEDKKRSLKPQDYAYQCASSDKDPIVRAISYIKDHFADDLSIDDIAQQANVSKSSLHRHFKRYTGRTILDYLNEYRISQACDLLATSQDPIYHIAEICGFRNLSNFNRRFHQYQTLSPRDYRQKMRDSSYRDISDYNLVSPKRGAVPARPDLALS